jgi:uncharacterized protein with PIN domain
MAHRDQSPKHRIRSCPSCGHNCGGNPDAVRCPECGDRLPVVRAPDQSPKHRVRNCPRCGHDCGGNPGAARCPECGDQLPAVRARLPGEDGPDASFRQALESLWRAAAMTAIVGTCAATSYAPVFTGLLILGLGGFRAIAWWRLDREGWLKHPSLLRWRPWIKGVSIAELSSAAVLIVGSTIFSGTRSGPVVVNVLQACALAAIGLQLVGLMRIVQGLWRHLNLPPAEWFDELALPAMIAGCIGWVQVPLGRALSLMNPGSAGEKILVLVTVIEVLGLVAAVFALFVLVDRANRVAMAVGYLEGLDPPADLPPDWDGTQRPRKQNRESIPGAARVIRRRDDDDDPIPLD